ncbi:hypothetical protein [Aquimarina pacifica]|uniref:hypothetical protein n=1 Tax=Aquimarina pacifica TaxID=1296415 RepID=UPI00046FB817|nr:hypothetical protein [Aquimarina pacifica]
MKICIKLIFLLFLIGITSCKDLKKEEEETKVIVEKIEAIETELDQISEDVDAKVKELEASLEDLDSI